MGGEGGRLPLTTPNYSPHSPTCSSPSEHTPLIHAAICPPLISIHSCSLEFGFPDPPPACPLEGLGGAGQAREHQVCKGPH